MLSDVLRDLSKLDDVGKKKLSFCEQIELRVAEAEPKLAVRLLPRKGTKLRADVYAPLFPPQALVVIAGSPEDSDRTQSFAITSNVTLRIPVGFVLPGQSRSQSQARRSRRPRGNATIL
ncbi:MAG: hypothetical protein QM784_35505 [Polyangiaceae bacterium]